MKNAVYREMLTVATHTPHPNNTRKNKKKTRKKHAVEETFLTTKRVTNSFVVLGHGSLLGLVTRFGHCPRTDRKHAASVSSHFGLVG